jgi:heme ABC exporter ATP-binding subunit CcmA
VITAVELRAVSKLYGRTAALKSVTLRLAAGETLALLGPNGSGKTTLLKIVAGALAPSRGSGSIFGLDLVTDRRELRSLVGLLATESCLYDDLSARENLGFTLTMAGQRVDHRELDRVLAEVGLAAHGDERVRSFSNGMKRRAALARLLLLRPRLLLLDEPFNSLDTGGAELVEALIRATAAADGAAILATHDAERALSVAGRVAVLDRGTATYVGPVHAYRARHAQHVG